MTLVSIDVGIRNLAYCVFDASMSIVDWNVINLMNREPETKQCNALTKKGVGCGKKAKYEKGNACLCEKHAIACDFLMPFSFVPIKRLKIKELQDYALSWSFAYQESEKKSVLLPRLMENLSSRMLSKIRTVKANAGTLDLISIGRNIKTTFDATASFRDATVVVIENQISPIATRMKTIQGMVAQYFIMKHENIVIEFVSSVGKLKGFQKQNENLDSEYAQHKKDAVFYCNRYLETDQYNEWKSKMDAKKKDDLADCFLQGICYRGNLR